MSSVEKMFWENWGGTEFDGRDLSEEAKAEICKWREKLWKKHIAVPLKS